MRFRIGLFAAFVLLASIASAQDATGASRFQWDQDGTDLPTVQSYVVNHYSDGAAGLVLNAVVCVVNAATFTCTAPIPAYTPGLHVVNITASVALSGGGFLESGHSNDVNFNMVATPATPRNFRLAFYINEHGAVEWVV
jgi:hypothetical protein